jgi:hypothetical protein
MTLADDSTLNKVARSLSDAPKGPDSDARSMLLQLAVAYSSGEQSLDGATQPTGFNPFAAALFEAVLESAFLVATADGEFDAVERAAFVKVVGDACAGKVSTAQVDALLSDLADLLNEDGLDKRIHMVGKTVTRPEHGEEVLRVAGLLAHVSAGVSPVERQVLEKLSERFGLDVVVLDRVLGEVRSAVSDEQ